MVAILGFSKDQITSAVQQMYSEVATSPDKQFHFPTGRDACLFVGYPVALLDTAPATAAESFAGVGFPFRADVIRQGDRVLDVGSGSGTDTLIAAKLVGPGGKVWALDMTPAMVKKLGRNVGLSGMRNVELLEGNAESIPLPDASVDVVTSNGVLNLVPDKARAFAEIFRVLRPGGRVQIADIVVSKPVGEKSRSDPKLWAECVVGAAVEEDYLDLFRAAGFENVEVLRRFDYFSGSASADTRRIASGLGAHTIEITMQRPLGARSSIGARAQRLHPAVLVRRARRHGLVGLIAAAAPLIACYGTLAVVAALGLMGLTVPISSGAWAAVIAALAVVAPIAIAWNRRAHGMPGPAIVAAAGSLAVLYALLVAYDWRVEAAGFITMLGAAIWDRRLFQRAVNC